MPLADGWGGTARTPSLTRVVVMGGRLGADATISGGRHRCQEYPRHDHHDPLIRMRAPHNHTRWWVVLF